MAEPAKLDRRHLRRQETIEQVLDVAVGVMLEQGVAGLTLGEVARRMGIRPPSLYVYYDSKNALYDALFERGWRLLGEALRRLADGFDGSDPVAEVHAYGTTLVRWAVEHRAYAPLMFWRPVPGFAPSDRAYGPAVELVATNRAQLAGLRDRGVLRADVDLDLAFRTWTAVTAGVISQQLSNAPDEPFETGTFTSVLPEVIGMWLARFGGPHVHPPDPSSAKGIPR